LQMIKTQICDEKKTLKQMKNQNNYRWTRMKSSNRKMMTSLEGKWTKLWKQKWRNVMRSSDNDTTKMNIVKEWTKKI
jgi:hypothetical protein